MTSLPSLNERSALFLDFDGTLADLAPRPDAVVIPHDLVMLLQALQTRLGGAVAIVTGRTAADIDPWLAPLRLGTAFEHGALRRSADGTEHVHAAPDLGPALAAACALAEKYPHLLVERKRTSLALHYRQALHLEARCIEVMGAAVAQMPGLQLQRGKAVVEVKPDSVGKGRAIAAFMAEAPFAGRVPVFAGDDVTDEAGFEVVQQLGGHAIKVGDGVTAARHRCASPGGLRAWLAAAVRNMKATP
ncbi:MAG: trehalose-phosphatase [Betaproteobacteria bacterium HGW-Betaproteobacteria-3]|jgi:trehalose 6-phosphate phosphatase|nr:MAG: trehalose-phosphatase [Betaproteobacteria bacterium HGW-Betaproteobacteria-3]